MSTLTVILPYLWPLLWAFALTFAGIRIGMTLEALRQTRERRRKADAHRYLEKLR